LPLALACEKKWRILFGFSQNLYGFGKSQMNHYHLYQGLKPAAIEKCLPG
jgi:hypothetical protein